ncbi:LysR substrate-binding domain-containing protein [uncultured Desulfovibrio sp.]|uniref:LysR substrate-binding domain-containing protein n=1 Tax=uncultured Desulfovibrio sp. TaxID=167968 RepID=UPI002622AA14|nr:LysR substrate-binding domain-containing protein [uncultured Desulfovibrio sp.]
MTLRHMEVFLALARNPNMREVAELLCVSQAAVSSALRGFEDELGSQLFVRAGRGLLLNEKGRLLEKRLAPIYAELRNVLDLTTYATLAGRLTIGASTTLADFVLPVILYDFHSTHPNVRIRCESGNTHDILRDVENGLLDVGFVEGQVRSLALNVRPLAQERLLVVSGDRESAAAGPVSIRELMQRRWLLREQGSGAREAFLAAITPLGIRPRDFLEFNHYDPIKILLHKPGTLACVSRFIVQRELEAQELWEVPLSDIRIGRTFYRVEHRGRQPSPLVEVISDLIQNYLEHDAPDTQKPQDS